MSEAKTEKKERDWSTRVGTVKADSLETFKTKDDKDALRAIVVNAEGKESIVEAYTDAAQEKLKAAVGSDKPMVFRGPAYFTEGNVPHLLVSTVNPQAEKAPEKTAEEIEASKEARAEASRLRAIEADKSRYPVAAGSVAAGDTIIVNGADQVVSKLGAEVELTDESAARYEERFPGAGFKAGDKVAFAYFEAPEADARKEDDAPAP